MDDAMNLMKKAAEIRRDLLSLIYNSKTGHTGGSLSSADILTVLYYRILRIDPKAPKDPFRDRFVLSKGHSVGRSLYDPCRQGVLSQGGAWELLHL